MNNKYKKYIEYIANDIQVPYLKSLEPYGLKQEEMDLVLGIVFNQPVHYIEPMHGVYNKDKVSIYHERSDGSWYKHEYDSNGNRIYYEVSNGSWYKREYDNNGKVIYHEGFDGSWYKREYDSNGNLIYHEGFDGVIIDNR